MTQRSTSVSPLKKTSLLKTCNFPGGLGVIGNLTFVPGVSGLKLVRDQRGGKIIHIQ